MMRLGALRLYEAKRNDPHHRCTSLMGAFLHFGHVAPLELAELARGSGAGLSSVERWLDELITWREMAIHVVFSRPAVYDTYQVLPSWARATLAAHKTDKRPLHLGLSALATAQSGDDVWDLAQAEGIVFGRMHGFLRMYWAKKLIAWMPEPEEAFNTALALNNRFFLDGRDPGSFLGVAWSFGFADKQRTGATADMTPIYGSLRPPSPAVHRRVDRAALAEQILLGCRAVRSAELRAAAAGVVHRLQRIARPLTGKPARSAASLAPGSQRAASKASRQAAPAASAAASSGSITRFLAPAAGSAHAAPLPAASRVALVPQKRGLESYFAARSNASQAQPAVPASKRVTPAEPEE
jgi:hypothetical protein